MSGERESRLVKFSLLGTMLLCALTAAACGQTESAQPSPPAEPILAFARGDDTWFLGEDSEPRRGVAGNPENWSPDGKRLVWRARVHGSHPRAVASA